MTSATKKPCVYQLRNVRTEEKYIGSAIRPVRRERMHWAQLRKGTHHSKLLQSAFDLFGEGCFAFEIIEYCTVDALLATEQRILDQLKPAYNYRLRAESRLGKTTSRETRKKLQLALLGKQHSAERRETNRRSSLELYGSERGKIVRAKIKAARARQVISPETWAKQSDSLKDYLRRNPVALERRRLQLRAAHSKWLKEKRSR